MHNVQCILRQMHLLSVFTRLHMIEMTTGLLVCVCVCSKQRTKIDFHKRIENESRSFNLNIGRRMSNIMR